MTTSTTSSTDYVVGFTPNEVWAGLLGSTMAQVGGTGGGGLLGPDIESATMIDPTDATFKIWAVDGTASKIIDVIGDKVSSWAAAVTAVNLGVLPDRCALCCRYSGRIVLARQPDNDAIFYMSRKFNPLDWKFGAIPVATAAVAGTDPTIGQPGDAITALIPAGDDYLVFGCRSSMYVMVGDPGFNGVVNNLTRRTGVLGPRSWCFDNRNMLWFLGNDGLNILQGPNQQPINVGGSKLIGLLDKVDITATLVQMALDPLKKEVSIFLTPRDGSVGTHIAVDQLNGNILDIRPFLDQFPSTYGPWSALSIDAEDDANRCILIGCNDGYIRKRDDAAKSDDGDAINSYFDSAPVEWTDGDRESTAVELQPFGYAGTDPVTWQWFVADSPDEVRQLTASPAATGSFFIDAGFNQASGLRVTGGAHKIRVSQNSATLSWAMERITAKFQAVGRRR